MISLGKYRRQIHLSNAQSVALTGCLSPDCLVGSHPRLCGDCAQIVLFEMAAADKAKGMAK